VARSSRKDSIAQTSRRRIGPRRGLSVSVAAPAPAKWTARSHGRASRPAQIEVLVLDADYRQALAAMRSLSRSGIDVGAVACKSEAPWAPALKSRWCRMSAVVPDFAEDADTYVDAVIGLLDEYPARLILPCHDGSIQALRGRRAELERRAFVPLASEAALDIAVSKTRTLALARELGIAVPRSVPLTDVRDVRAAINEVGGCPAIVKPIHSWGQFEGLGTRWGCDAVVSLDEATQRVGVMLGAGLQPVIQEWLPGRRDAVSFFCAYGRIWARFAQTSYRESPPIGGASVLCESIPPLADLIDPAERLIRAAGLEGCSMVEFRRDRAGRPVLMEINARMAGSVALAISAGVDFPKLLYSWALGKPLREVTSYHVGRRLRWLSGDLWNLKQTFNGRRRPDTPSPGRAVATFLFDFVRRPSTLDVVDSSDLMPALFEMRHTLAELLERASRSALGRWRRMPERRNGSARG
jgi:predicted ATP-grasp superfamily ATP-dependent carboligase